MKRYIRSANRFTNKATQLISKGFSEDYIKDKAANGYHKDEAMSQVYNNIMNDPNVSFGDKDKSGNQDILYSGKTIGWINFGRGVGNIDKSAYDKLVKYAEPEVDDEVFIDDSYEDYSDVEFDDDDE